MSLHSSSKVHCQLLMAIIEKLAKIGIKNDTQNEERTLIANVQMQTKMVQIRAFSFLLQTDWICWIL